MSARKRGRRARAVLVAIAAAGFFGSQDAHAQGFFGGKREAAAKPAARPAAVSVKEEPAAKAVLTAVPVNPTDPIATVNNEVITREQLATECVARRGKEILETLIARKLIEQALRKAKLEVTPAEVDQEIDRVANQLGGGIGREAWLRTLDKEKGISPVQYARDIIYPALALRKLASPMVQVTEDDERIAFEAQYGDKVRVRLIMTDTLRKAQEIWEELRKSNGQNFERLAQERSMDTGSRSLGGLLAEPISRHAFPTHVSDAAFRQLVDGDKTDKTAQKPKDGAISGPIQVAEATWVILKREEVIPAQPGVTLASADVRKQMHEMIYEVKLKEAMNEYYVGLVKAALIDNRLTGTTKEANEDAQYAEHAKADEDVKLMGGQANLATKQKPTTPGNVVPSKGRKPTAPVGAPKDDVLTRQAEALKQAPVAPAVEAQAPASPAVK